MNILLIGYLDRNFGDDIMLRITADCLPEHRFFLKTPVKEVLLPFSGTPNILDADDYPDVSYSLILRVTGSGFFVSSKIGLFYYLKEHFRFKKSAVPKAVIGCNIGPFMNFFVKRLIMRELDSYRLITVRESFSRELLKKRADVRCYPDIVFSLPDKWIPDRACEDCLGISAYWVKEKNNLPFYKKMAAAADNYIEKKNKKVLLFAFDTQCENDLCAAYSIRALCRHREMVEIIAHDDDGSRIIENFRRCSKIIAVRFHSLILAMRMNIGFVPVLYSDKTAHVLDDLGYTGKAFRIQDFDMGELLDEIYSDSVFRADESVAEMSKMHIRYLKEALL